MNAELKVGSVFRWDDFPYNRYGDGDKARWFVCVGFTGAFAQTALIYSYTTTSQLQNFEPGGIRHGHSHFIFKCAEHQCFEMDCAIDFDERPYTIEMKKIRQFSYWAVRELGYSATHIAKKLNRTVAGVVYAMRRGESLAKQQDFKLLKK